MEVQRLSRGDLQETGQIVRALHDGGCLLIEPLFDELLRQLKDVRGLWETATNQERKLWVELVFPEIKIDLSGHISIRGFFPAGVILSSKQNSIRRISGTRQHSFYLEADLA